MPDPDLGHDGTVDSALRFAACDIHVALVTDFYQVAASLVPVFLSSICYWLLKLFVARLAMRWLASAAAGMAAI